MTKASVQTLLCIKRGCLGTKKKEKIDVKRRNFTNKKLKFCNYHQLDASQNVGNKTEIHQWL